MRSWIVLASVFLVGGGVAVADSAAPGGFKNLQVLPKNISKDDLKALMKAQSKALGVECDFCHDVPDMASDKIDKKLAARKMMQMTMDINDKWLKGWKEAEKNRVTCGTCHQGHEEPPRFVPTGGDKPEHEHEREREHEHK
jgi:hypothetical protein